MKSSSVEEAGGGKSTEMSTEDSDSERSVMAVTAEVFAAALVEGVETFALKREGGFARPLLMRVNYSRVRVDWLTCRQQVFSNILSWPIRSFVCIRLWSWDREIPT